MVAVKLLDIIPVSITFENILSVRVLEWLVILVGGKIEEINQYRQDNLKIHLSDYAHFSSRGEC